MQDTRCASRDGGFALTCADLRGGQDSDPRCCPQPDPPNPPMCRLTWQKGLRRCGDGQDLEWAMALGGRLLPLHGHRADPGSHRELRLPQNRAGAGTAAPGGHPVRLVMGASAVCPRLPPGAQSPPWALRCSLGSKTE